MTTEPEVREWRFELNTMSPTTVGERILALSMFSPNQLFRMFRANHELIIVAVEGEVWSESD